MLGVVVVVVLFIPYRDVPLALEDHFHQLWGKGSNSKRNKSNQKTEKAIMKTTEDQMIMNTEHPGTTLCGIVAKGEYTDTQYQ